MPFQVSLCATTNITTVIAISLRPDVFSPCIVSLDLIATVTSGRIEGHTLLWELHSGSQVVFTTPVNQLIATCTLLDSTDKVFYFWVDKGTSKEKYYVFNYYGTAIDYIYNQFANTLILSNSIITNGSPDCSTIAGTPAIFNANPAGQGVLNPTNLVLTWQLPLNTINLWSISVEQNISGVWANILNLLPTDPQILTNATNDTYYRIKTIYKIDNGYYSQYSCIYYLLINTADKNIYIDDILYNSFNNTTTATVLTNYTLLSTDSATDEIFDITTNYFGNTITPIVVVYYGGTIIGG